MLRQPRAQGVREVVGGGARQPARLVDQREDAASGSRAEEAPPSSRSRRPGCRRIPRKLQSTPSAAYSACSPLKTCALNCCCRRSLARLMHSCSKELSSKHSKP